MGNGSQHYPIHQQHEKNKREVIMHKFWTKTAHKASGLLASLEKRRDRKEKKGEEEGKEGGKKLSVIVTSFFFFVLFFYLKPIQLVNRVRGEAPCQIEHIKSSIWKEGKWSKK